MAVFLDRVPGCFFFVGCAKRDAAAPPLSAVRPRQRALAIGTIVLEAVAREAARRI
jgi:hypothetical protein